MRRTPAVLLAVLTCTLMFIGLGAQPAAALIGTSFPICAKPGGQDYPDVYQDKVVWADRSTRPVDVWMKNLTSGEETQISHNASGWVDDPHVWGNRVVWPNEGDLYVHDLTTGVTSAVTGAGYGPGACDISGDKIVTLGREVGSFMRDLYAYDLSTGQKTRLTDGTLDQMVVPPFWGNKVVWEANGDIGPLWRHDICLHDLGTGQTKRLTHDSVKQIFPMVSDTKVAWSEERSSGLFIGVYDLATGTRRFFPKDVPNMDSQALRIWHDTLVFKGGVNSKHIYVCDLVTGIKWQVARSACMSLSIPAIWGNLVVWCDARNDPAGGDIYGCYVQPAALTAPAAPRVARRGGTFVASGSLIPGRAAGKNSLEVRCYRLERGRWVRKETRPAPTSGTARRVLYRASVTLHEKGSWLLRTFYKGTRYAPARSSCTRLRAL